MTWPSFLRGGRRRWRNLTAALLLAAILVPSPAAVAAPEQRIAATLSLADTKALAAKNNTQARLAFVRFEKSDVAARQARNAADQISTGSVNSYQRAQQKYVMAKQAEANQAAAAAARDQTLRGVRLQVESAYYSLWLAQERVRVTQAGLDRAREQLRVSQAQLEAGAVARSDVLSAELQVASMESSLVTANRALESARIQLNSLLARPLDAPIAAERVDVEPARSLPGLDEGVAQALERRAETVQTRESRAVAELDTRLAAEYYPENVDPRQIAELALREAELQDELSRQQVEVDVRQTFLGVGEATQRLALANKSREQAQEAFRLATLRYQAGVGTILEVTGAHVALYQSEVDVATAQFDLKVAEARYLAAIGQNG